MAIFGQGRKGRSPMDILGEFSLTPGGGIGGGLPGMPMDPNRMGGGMVDTSVPEDPYAGERPQKPGFFAKGGGWKDALGEGLGALAQQFGGTNPYNQARDRQHEEAMLRLRGDLDNQAEDRRQAARDADVNIFGNGDDGFFSFSKSGGVNPLVPGTGPKEDTVIARLRAAGIDPNSPEGRQAIMMSMPGYGYSPEVFGRKTTLKQTVPGKAAGTGRAAPKPPAGFILD
ncbi:MULTISPECIES: hypothetical protein [unclassified Sphingomonas]|uniref:hypothetical protein n=1 Tax=unclassified Sphingomonas TaxID=196159 RepID=UPI0006FADAA3|nr:MULTISPECIES: hypothetical protein [unclassified Sphingomonas]KRB87672.1 hypothetical protein ASE22_23490 [Sphingomonas sp. Root720]